MQEGKRNWEERLFEIKKKEETRKAINTTTTSQTGNRDVNKQNEKRDDGN